MLKLNIVKEVHSDPFVVFASLPDMGRVGGLTSTFLASQFDAKMVASITSVEKPWVSVKDGLAANVIDTYNIYYSDIQKLLVLSGNNQPEDPRELFELCTTFLDYCMSIGRITRLGGWRAKTRFVNAQFGSGHMNAPSPNRLVFQKSGLLAVGTSTSLLL